MPLHVRVGRASDVAGSNGQPPGRVDVDDLGIGHLLDGPGDVVRVVATERAHREDPGTRVGCADLAQVGEIAGLEVGAAERSVVGALVATTASGSKCGSLGEPWKFQPNDWDAVPTLP